MVKSVESVATMSVRRNSTTANGYVQSRNSRPRRRNAVANIFSELSEGDVRALRQQAQEMLHPAAMGASTSCSSSSDSSGSSTEELNRNFNNAPADQKRRRRNALHDIGVGIDHAELRQLREQALAMHHPAVMMTTPPGAPGAAGSDLTLTPRRAAPRSVSMMASAASGAMDNLLLPDGGDGSQSGYLGDPQTVGASPSQIFTVDSITNAVYPHGSSLTRSVSSNVGASSQQQSSASSSSADIITLTETDGDIFRERIARSSTR